jgi:hypothetical protein
VLVGVGLATVREVGAIKAALASVAATGSVVLAAYLLAG